MTSDRGAEYVQRLHEAAKFISSFGRTAETAMVLGSGLGDFAASIEDALVIPYQEIPNFFPSSVIGHAGRLVFGTVDGKKIVAMQGRIHCYEGYTAAQVAFGVRALAFAGARRFLVTNAAGGLNPEFEPVDLMLIENHISLFSQDPSSGLHHPELGERFYPQTDPYNLKRALQIESAAKEQGVRLRRGVFCYVPGPRFESRADIKALRTLGADAVAMSTVPEVLALLNLGINDITGISLITNLAAGIRDSSPNHEEVLAVAEAAKPEFEKVVRAVIAAAPEE